MPKNLSPLRYPGGKTKLYLFIRDIIRQNNLNGGTYVEPFAGGAGLALKLLLNNDVKQIIINDYNFAIYSIWHCILNFTDDFCQKIIETDINMTEWDNQKKIYLSQTKNIFDMGFATFFLNRTNRSGIITGGVIGGRKQNNKYKIDARFNKDILIKKIKLISNQKDRIIIKNMHANNFLRSDILRYKHKIFINFDPPYVLKSSRLYKNSFNKQDHINLFKLISKCTRKWVVTYDVCDFIENLYKNFRKTKINVNYSAMFNNRAKEFVFFSNNLILPDDIILY